MALLKKEKHEAVRTCIASGKKFPKQEMVRFVRTPEGRIEVDLTGKKSGRGANMAMQPDFFELALKKRAFQRAFKLEKQLSREDENRLRQEFLDAIEQRSFRKGKQKVTIKVSKEQLDKLKT